MHRAFPGDAGDWYDANDGGRTAAEIAEETAERMEFRRQCAKWLGRLLPALRGARPQAELGVLTAAPAAALDALEVPELLAAAVLLSDLLAFEHGLSIDQVCTTAGLLVERYGPPSSIGAKRVKEAVEFALADLYPATPRATA